MLTDHNEHAARIERLKKIQEKGINPYPAKSNRTHIIKEVIGNFGNLLESQTELTIAGRIMSLRQHGGSSFADLNDGSGKMQVYLKKDLIDNYQTDFAELIDIGDFIEVKGILFQTKAGEKTLLVNQWIILTKAIKALPSQWYGLKDHETRWRKRYLDLLLNDELKEVFRRKAIFWNSMREFLISRDFLEVYTPVLETTTGGADAKPFITHHNTLDINVYLRISMGELWQKRLIVAGFEKTFEIGRQFRNEGIDQEHLQDYTQMEYYWAYADYEQGMNLTEELIRYVAQKTWGALKFKVNEMEVDLGMKWGRIDFQEEVKKRTGLDINTAIEAEMKSKLDELKMEYEPTAGRGRLMDILWKYCRKQISGPVYLINAPVEVSPLAKRVDAKPQATQRFQLILGGTEVCNGYSELNDPVDQRERFLEQAQLRAAGDEEAQMNDEDFVEALEYGMPPTCGLGISERLFALLEGKPIRECVMFPLLRPLLHGIHNIEKENYVVNIGITREEALRLLGQHIKNQNFIKHHLAVEAQMLALAEYFAVKNFESAGDSKSINPNAWAMTGLLHDLDWEETEQDFNQHSLKTAEILNNLGVHPAIIKAIKVHNYIHGIEPETLLEKSLYCAEELTGLVVAAALVQPDKKLASVDVASVVNKFKDKSFARGVNREIILKCKEYLGLELAELIEITVKAMQRKAGELGL